MDLVGKERLRWYKGIKGEGWGDCGGCNLGGKGLNDYVGDKGRVMGGMKEKRGLR